MANFSGHGNIHSGSINGTELFGPLSDSQLQRVNLNNIRKQAADHRSARIFPLI
jgi:hypothetical protein